MAALVAAVLWFCYLSRLDAIGLVGPDEPRYAWVAREMAESGDWVTPRLYGKPWFEKPVLYYWGAAVGYRVFGDTEIAARLPSAVAALLATLGIAWAAMRFYGGGAALAALLILPTSVGMIGFARAATPDMTFSTMLALALVAASQSLGLRETMRPSRLSLMLFGALLGAATLAKGPAAVVLAGGSVALWALVTRRWRNAFWLAHPWAIFTFIVVAGPWYAVCAARNPEFVDVFIIAHNFERYFTPVFRHEQPFWFFGPIVLIGLLPWTVLLAGVGRDAVRTWQEKNWRDSAGFFFACWVIFPVLFFSASKSKLPGYILPAIPPLVFLAARSIARLIEERHAMAHWILFSVVISLVLLTLGSSAALVREPAGLPYAVREGISTETWLWCLLLLEVTCLLPLLWRWNGTALVLVGMLLAGTVEYANLSVVRRLDAQLSAREFGLAVVRNHPRAAEQVSVHGVHRAWHYGLNYYLRRELPPWKPSAPAYVIVSDESLLDLLQTGSLVEPVPGVRSNQKSILVRVSVTH